MFYYYVISTEPKKMQKTLAEHFRDAYWVEFRYYVEGIEHYITYDSDDYTRNPVYWEARFAQLQDCNPTVSRASTRVDVY
jgi:hypothetical protein